ncbi:MAG: PAS domain S-box protein [Candidatus Thorarchaeota archaeon]
MTKDHPHSNENEDTISVEDEALRYRALVEHMADGFGVINTKGVLTYVNKYFAKLLEYKPEEMIGYKIVNFLDNDNRRILEENVEKRKEGISSSYELEWTTRYGGKVPAIVSGAPLFSKDNEHLGSFAVITDIADRLRTEQALRESEERLRRTFDAIPGGAYLWTQQPDGEIILGSVNNVVVDQTNGVALDFIDKKLREIFVHSPFVIDSVEEVMTSGESKRDEKAYSIYPAPENWFIWEYTRPTEGVVLMITTNITDRRQMEEELRESEERYRLVTSQIREIIWTLDMNMRFTYISPSAEQMLGVNHEELLFQPVSILMTQKSLKETVDDLKKGIDETANGSPRSQEREAPLELELKHVDGSIVIAEVTRTFIRDENDVPIGILGVARDITGKRKVEEALKESEERFRRIYRESPVGIELFDKDGVLIDANQAALDIGGIKSLENLIGFNLFSDPNLPEDVKKKIQNGESVRYEAEFDFEKVKDSNIFDTYRSGIIYLDALLTPLGIKEDGSLRGYLNQIIETTDQKKAQEAMLATERKYHRLYDSMVDGFVNADLDGHYLEFNKAYLDLVGYTEDELRELTFHDITPEKWHALDKKITDEQLMVEGVSELFEKEYIRKDGKVVPVEVRLYLTRDENGIPNGSWAIVRDISDRKQAKELMAASETKYRSLVDQSFQGILIVKGPSIKIVFSNPAFAGFLGMNTEEVYLLSESEIIRIIHPEDRQVILNRFQALFNGDPPRVIPLVIRITRTDGTTRWLELIGRLIDYEGGPALQIAVTDITHRRLAEKEIQSQTDRAMLYLDLMGHDIRNQLQAIMGNAAVLGERVPNPDVENLVARIVESVERCDSMISKIKVTEPLMSIDLEIRDLVEATSKSLMIIKTYYPDVELDSEISMLEAHVEADRFLEELLANILDNGIRHNPKDKRKLWIKLYEESSGFILSISDNGPGIQDKTKISIFDISRRFGGIGLHQAKQIVDKYGGSINILDRVYGKSEEGVDFQIWLPAFKG